LFGWGPALVATVVAVTLAASPRAAQSQAARADVGGAGELSDTSEVDTCAEEAGNTEQIRDQRTSEHYERGRLLYEQGNFEGAVDEFVAAYCHGGYLSLLIDIAQAFERQSNYEKAVAYLDRYIAAAGDDEQVNVARWRRRAQTWRQLPARIQVATEPPGATVTLTGATGVAGRFPANADRIRVPHGTYEMRIELPGYQTVVREVTARINEPYTYFIPLEPEKGSVRIAVSPRSARLFLDDRLVGVGGFSGDLPIGSYELLVEGRDREPQRRSLQIGAGTNTDLRIKLAKPPRSGRLELVIASTTAGGLVGGGTSAQIFGEGTLPAGVGFALGTGIGFAGGYFGAPDDIPVGYSSYIIGTTVIVASQGALLTSLICSCGTETPGFIGLASGAVGLGLAAATAGRFDLDAGDAAMVNSGAIWGAATGGLFFAVFDQDDRLGEALVLVGTNLGLLAGATLAARHEVSRGHVALVDLAGLSGVVAGFALGRAVGDAAAERDANFALGGMIAGLSIGAFLTRNMDVPRIDTSTGSTSPTVTRVIDADGNGVTTFGLGGTF